MYPLLCSALSWNPVLFQSIHPVSYTHLDVYKRQHVSYENKDEMGTLCKEFEMMRSDLADNNRKMWRMIDDEKALRNAIAHDIR